MTYTKPALTVAQQADLLLTRGMAGDRAQMIERLARVNYYRLSGYWYTFRQPDPAQPGSLLDTFKPGTRFDEAWGRYVFDRRLRLLVMDAIERFEVAFRTQLSYHHARRHGPFAYMSDPASLPSLRWERWLDFVCRVRDETQRSRDSYIDSFRRRYGNSHPLPPIWITSEVMSLGTSVTLFIGMSKAIKRDIAAIWGVPDVVFESWLHTLNSVRNICAHHGRLWNRRLPTKPLIPNPRKYPDWHKPVLVDNNSVFAIMTICRWSLRRIAPQSQWAERLRSLLAASPGIALAEMGLPPNWRDCPLWQ